MKITYLGQNGLFIESKNSKIYIDPYLSDSVARTEPKNKRRQPIDAKYLLIKPDVIVITHMHGDHYDIETLDMLLYNNEKCTLIIPPSVFVLAKKRYPQNNCVYMRNGTSYTINGVLFIAVKAEHSDTESIGIIVSAEEKNLYITGDTLYNENVFSSLPNVSFDVVFLPINGYGNNMNAVDAKRFANRIDAKTVVPVHFGMFDDITGQELACENKVIPEIYKEIKV